MFQEQILGDMQHYAMCTAYTRIPSFREKQHQWDDGQQISANEFSIQLIWKHTGYTVYCIVTDMHNQKK